MKKNKFLLLGTNATFDLCDKSRLIKSYTVIGAQTIGTIAANISKICKGKNMFDILSIKSPREERNFIKIKANNLKSIKNRLDSLGQVEFCAWAIYELDNNKQFAYGFYHLIETGVIKENENFSFLKAAICDSLKRNDFKYDLSKSPPNIYKEFVNYSDYSDMEIMMKLQRNPFDYVSERPKMR